MSKISVIVLVFQVQKYIERCSRSLFEQTLDDIEYLFINDCTKDASISILRRVLDEYPNRRDQVRIIDMPVNSGQAVSRRKGIELATGEYIIHCDSDDYIRCNMYETLYSLAKHNEADIVVCGWSEGDDTNSSKFSLPVRESLFESILLYSQGHLWNKLVKKDIVKNNSILFPRDNMGEDLCLTAQYSILASNVVYTKEPLYFYYRHPESILGDRSIDAMVSKQRQLKNNFSLALDALDSYDVKTIYQDAIIHECLYIKNMLLPAIAQGKCLPEWKETFREINSKVLFSSIFTLREKLNYIITYIGLYPVYKKLFD